jgi:hypothetical protein
VFKSGYTLQGIGNAIMSKPKDTKLEADVSRAVRVAKEIYKQVSNSIDDFDAVNSDLFSTALVMATRIYCAQLQTAAIYDTGPM